MAITLGPGLDDSVKIARYMSFPAFMYMLQFRKAFIPSVTNLRGAGGNHGDPLEGTWGRFDDMTRSGDAMLFDMALNSSWPSDGSGPLYEDPQPKIPDEHLIQTPFGDEVIPIGGEHLRALNNRLCMWVDAWCWHRFDREYMSMWRQYGGDDGAVCVRTTIGNLRRSIGITPGVAAYIGEMHYGDKESPVPDSHGAFSLYLQKLDAYKYEHEIRMLVYEPDAAPTLERQSLGRHVEVNNTLLMQDVIVHPDAPEWIFTLAKGVTQAHIGRSARRSDIYQARQLSRA